MVTWVQNRVDKRCTSIFKLISFSFSNHLLEIVSARFSLSCAENINSFWKWNDRSAVFVLEDTTAAFWSIWDVTSHITNAKPACGLLCQVAQRSLHFRLGSYRNKSSTNQRFVMVLQQCLACNTVVRFTGNKLIRLQNNINNSTRLAWLADIQICLRSLIFIFSTALFRHTTAHHLNWSQLLLL